MKISKSELEALSSLSLSDIANIYGVTRQAVSLWFKKYNILKQDPPSTPSKEDLEQFKHLSLNELSKQYGVSKQTISLWFKKYNIQKDSSRGRTPLPKPPKEELESLKHKSLDEIALIYNSNATTVGRWLKRYSIVRPSLQGKHFIVEKDIPPKEELAQHSDKTYREIAIIYGVNHNTVNSWFKLYSMSRKQNPNKNLNIQDIKKALIHRILNDDSFALTLHSKFKSK